MSLYAQFDPNSGAIAPVIGWYDTSILEYPNLPPDAHLVEMTPAEWALHFQDPNGWTIQKGRLTPPAND